MGFGSPLFPCKEFKMANRTFSRVQALNHGVKVISGSIINAIASPTLVGLGFSAAADGDEVQITLDDKYISLMSATANAKIDDSAGISNSVVIRSHDVASAKTVNLEIMSTAADGTTATHPLGDADELHFTLVLRNNSADSR